MVIDCKHTGFEQSTNISTYRDRDLQIFSDHKTFNITRTKCITVLRLFINTRSLYPCYPFTALLKENLFLIEYHDHDS